MFKSLSEWDRFWSPIQRKKSEKNNGPRRNRGWNFPEFCNNGMKSTEVGQKSKANKALSEAREWEQGP